MNFSFAPDGGPPRILRFVDPDKMPDGDTLCTLDDTTNVLTINKELYELLDEMEQHRVQRTHAARINSHTRRRQLAA